MTGWQGGDPSEDASMRRLTDSDIDAARRIDALSFPAHDQYDADFYESVAISDNYDAVVAVDADLGIVGWALADLTCRPIRIRSVSVHPEFRRRGFGAALVREILNRRSAPVDLLVESNNYTALALYQKLKFSPADADPQMPGRLRMVWQPEID